MVNISMDRLNAKSPPFFDILVTYNNSAYAIPTTISVHIIVIFDTASLVNTCGKVGVKQIVAEVREQSFIRVTNYQ